MYTVIIRKREEYWRATHQEGLVELKQAGELFEQLVNTVQPLQEDGTLLAHIVSILLVATAVPKLMTVVQPVNLYKHLETLWTTWYSLLELIILQCNKNCAHNTALHRQILHSLFQAFYCIAKIWCLYYPQCNRLWSDLGTFCKKWLISLGPPAWRRDKEQATEVW